MRNRIDDERIDVDCVDHSRIYIQYLKTCVVDRSASKVQDVKAIHGLVEDGCHGTLHFVEHQPVGI